MTSAYVLCAFALIILPITSATSGGRINTDAIRNKTTRSSPEIAKNSIARRYRASVISELNGMYFFMAHSFQCTVFAFAYYVTKFLKRSQLLQIFSEKASCPNPARNARGGVQ